MIVKNFLKRLEKEIADTEALLYSGYLEIDQSSYLRGKIEGLKRAKELSEIKDGQEK